MRYDAIVVGSFARLSAALGLARRRVCVLDTRGPRNRFASHSHGLFGHDGSDPITMLETMRAQIAAYLSIDLLDEAAVGVSRAGDTFAVELANGETLTGTRLLLGFGITDTFPDLPGLAERWARR